MPTAMHALAKNVFDADRTDCRRAVLLSQSRMHALLAALGQPQRELRVAHITGTKGKGSTATMLSAILQAASYRVGTYTRCRRRGCF